MQRSHVVLVRDRQGKVWRSADEGFSWTRLNLSRPISHIARHDYRPDRVFLLVSGASVLYASTDFGATFRELPVPAPPAEILNFNGEVIDFHPDKPDWLIYTGQKRCPADDKCHTEAFFSSDNGAHWSLLDTYVVKCLFARDQQFTGIDERMIYCHSFAEKKGNQATLRKGVRSLYASTDFFKSPATVWKDDILGFFVVDNFLALGKASHTLTASESVVEGLI